MYFEFLLHLIFDQYVSSVAASRIGACDNPVCALQCATSALSLHDASLLRLQEELAASMLSVASRIHLDTSSWDSTSC